MTAPWAAGSLAGLNPSSTQAMSSVASTRTTRSFQAGNGATTDYVLGEVQTSRTAGCAGFSRYGSFTNNQTLLELLNSSGTAVLRLRTINTNVIQLQYWNGAAWVGIGSGITRSSDPARYLIDFSGMGGASGSLTFTMTTDGTETLMGTETASSLDLTSATNVARHKLYAALTGTASSDRCYDAFIKDGSAAACYVYSNHPTANGTDVDGTGDYTTVDDVGSSIDADFSSLPTSGNKRSYKSAARTLGSRSVKGVAIELRLRCGASGPTQCKPYLLIGATRYYHAASPVTLTTTFTSMVFVWELDPSTAAAWANSAAESANLEYGYEVV